MDLVVSAARVLVGVVFLVAAVGKARDVKGFAASVRELPGVPRVLGGLGGLAAPGVIVAEAAVAALLAAPMTIVWGFALAVILDTSFLVVILKVLRSGTSASCNCFGTTPREFGMRHVVRDLLLGAVALIGLAGAAGNQGRDGVSVPAWVLCALVGAVGALVLVLFDEIADLYA
ncbi:hypothetical protein GCM10009839_50050 [Catenulispora yoronensis]|uniref:Methylamine utilisation protein MauE domain-containing protein n=1 Tax=Catenulispora yoronensis TaxID=450799 RepID=A0ABN2URQ6_9ACTN